MKYTIEVIGKIKAKERPRLTKYGAVYTPKATRDSENLIAWYWQNENYPTFSGPVMVTIDVYRRPPSKMRKADKEKAMKGLIKPECTLGGDLDNICKTVLDGLNKVAYNDDKQVLGLVASYRYGEDKVVISVEEL